MKKHSFAASLAALALSASLLCGCSSASTAAPSSVAKAQDGTLRLTQSATVNKDSYSKVADYADFLAAAQPQILIPGLSEGMVPQGMDLCEANNRIYISGYFESDKLPSALAAVDASTGELVADYMLYKEDGTPFASHVGGVAVTDDTLYVSTTMDNDGSYTIAALPLSELAETGSQDVTVHTTIPLPVSPSFLNYSEGVLWVGNFYHPDKDYGLSPEMNYTTASADGDYGCYIIGYKLGTDAAARMAIPDGASYPIPDLVLASPDRIQGVTMPDSKTIVLSQSYGRKNDSSLMAYNFSLTDAPSSSVTVGGQSVPCYVLDSTCQRAQLTAMPMTEALAAKGDGSMYVLFECGAMHYSDGKNRTDHIWQLTLPD
jgi:hypothetical protein